MTIQKELRYYAHFSGKVPLVEWLDRFKDRIIRSRIRRRLSRLVEEGHYGDYKALGSGIYELRLNFGPGYRIYFAEQNAYIILL